MPSPPRKMRPSLPFDLDAAALNAKSLGVKKSATVSAKSEPVMMLVIPADDLHEIEREFAKFGADVPSRSWQKRLLDAARAAHVVDKQP